MKFWTYQSPYTKLLRKIKIHPEVSLAEINATYVAWIIDKTTKDWGLFCD